MFREITRKNKQLSLEECIHLLTQIPRGVLSLIGDEGYPYGVPLNYWYNPQDGNLYFLSNAGIQMLTLNPTEAEWEKAQVVDNLIAGLQPVTLEKVNAINATYNALTNREKSLVQNMEAFRIAEANFLITRIDAMAEAARTGNAKVFNMLVLGGLIKARPIATVEDVVKGLRKALPERHHKLIPMNEEAIRRGMEIIQKMN